MHHRRQRRGELRRAAHTLRYGVTTNHTLGLEYVLPDGEIVEVGGKALDAPGYDLTGLYVGSEGTLEDRDEGRTPVRYRWPSYQDPAGGLPGIRARGLSAIPAPIDRTN